MIQLFGPVTLAFARPMALIYELDLDILNIYLHTENKRSRSRHSKTNREQDTQTRFLHL